MTSNIFPWQSALVEQWLMPAAPRHHALLFYGKSGIGKLRFVRQMAARLLCQHPLNGLACGQCDACHWLAEGAHPDYREITPEDDEAGLDSKKKTRKREQILIDQIRTLNDYLSLSNHCVGGLRIVLIQPLEAMNIAASNALLKLLEEPPPHTQFLLVSHQRQALLPTILSRCMQIEMPAPDHSEGLEWLKSQAVTQPEWLWNYSGGAPLSIIDNEIGLDWYAWYVQWRPLLVRGASVDIAQAVQVLIKPGINIALQVLQKWLLDLWLSIYQLPVRYHMEEQATLRALAIKINLSRLLSFQQQLNRFKITAQHPLNQELQLEQLLLQYQKLFSAT